ncbi:unnamed protein product [Thlaspi arvense]|uniref:Late embryogenesis abundant protein LEA-2 subgroup domain-containing protein n=1 Tax=Thlaspi arvense TaxID=13288 RepID=A0AAU9STU3_THLAR|nr:unnamed protein product [Thlaspi arvense]
MESDWLADAGIGNRVLHSSSGKNCSRNGFLPRYQSSQRACGRVHAEETVSLRYQVILIYMLPATWASASPPFRRRRWWSRPIATHPATGDRKPTLKEHVAYCSPCYGGLFTFVAVILILYFADKAHCHAIFSIQSITVSPFSATWHVDFLVTNPANSRYSIYYEGDDAAVRLGPLNAAVLSTSHKRNSPSHTAFSLDFVAACNTSDVVLPSVGKSN